MGCSYGGSDGRHAGGEHTGSLPIPPHARRGLFWPGNCRSQKKKKNQVMPRKHPFPHPSSPRMMPCPVAHLSARAWEATGGDGAGMCWCNIRDALQGPGCIGLSFPPLFRMQRGWVRRDLSSQSRWDELNSST